MRHFYILVIYLCILGCINFHQNFSMGEKKTNTDNTIETMLNFLPSADRHSAMPLKMIDVLFEHRERVREISELLNSKKVDPEIKILLSDMLKVLELDVSEKALIILLAETWDASIQANRFGLLDPSLILIAFLFIRMNLAPAIPYSKWLIGGVIALGGFTKYLQDYITQKIFTTSYDEKFSLLLKSYGEMLEKWEHFKKPFGDNCSSKTCDQEICS